MDRIVTDNTLAATVERDALLATLDRTARIVERRNTIPILNNLMLRTAGATLEITATDLDLAAVATAPLEIGQDGATTVNAAMLQDIVRKSPAGSQLRLEMIDGGDRLAIRTGRSRFALHTLPAGDYPPLSEQAFTHQFRLAGTALSLLFDRPRFAISTEESRYYLNGIYFHVADLDGAPRLIAVATDGHRLLRQAVAVPDGAAGMPGIIVPRKTVGEIVRLARGMEGEVTVSLSERKIRFEFPGNTGPMVLTSKLIDGTYPDYNRVIPTGNDRKAMLDRDDFLAALERVLAVAGEKSRGVKFCFAADRCGLSVSNPDTGTAEEEIAAGYDGDEISIGFNGRYLLDVLGVLVGDTIEIAIDTPGGPTIFTNPGIPDLTAIVMPVRV